MTLRDLSTECMGQSFISLGKGVEAGTLVDSRLLLSVDHEGREERAERQVRGLYYQRKQ